MIDQNFPLVRKTIIILLSFFGVGFIPFAPGTFGSLATLPILYFLGKIHIPIFFLIPTTLLLVIFLSFITEYYQRNEKIYDAPWIVIDEVLGMLVCWFFWPTSDLLNLFLCFLFFRIFDIFKIWPASTIDKKMKHGAGVILDDIVSGLYAGTIVWLLQKFVLQS